MLFSKHYRYFFTRSVNCLLLFFLVLILFTIGFVLYFIIFIDKMWEGIVTMQNPVSDERYSVADEAILGAFFKLVKKKTTDQITVSDITKNSRYREKHFL